MSTITFKKTLITPELAAKLLLFTPHARPINHSRVRRYADDMSAGRWLETAETIKLSRDGVPVNGHHRLRAVVLSGVSVWFHVAHGVDPSALMAMDTGLCTRASDWSGRQNATRGFAMLNSILRGFGMHSPQPSRGCLQEMWDEFGDEHIQFGALARSRLVDATGSMAVACVHRVNRERASVMRDRLLQKASLPMHSPEQSWLRARGNRSRHVMETSAMALRMAVAAVKGDEVRLMKAMVNEQEAERVLSLSSVLRIKSK